MLIVRTSGQRVFSLCAAVEAEYHMPQRYEKTSCLINALNKNHVKGTGNKLLKTYILKEILTKQLP